MFDCGHLRAFISLSVVHATAGTFGRTAALESGHAAAPAIDASVRLYHPRGNLCRLFEIGLHGFYFGVRMDEWQTKKVGKDPPARPVPALGRKWRSRAWPDPQESRN